jgi:hypothetical protein
MINFVFDILTAILFVQNQRAMFVISVLKLSISSFRFWGLSRLAVSSSSSITCQDFTTYSICRAWHQVGIRTV